MFRITEDPSYGALYSICLKITRMVLSLDRIILRWSSGSVLAFSIHVRGFKPCRSRRIFRAKNFSALLPSEGK